MSLGWFADLDDAEEYFTLERLETSAWDELESGDARKLKAVVMAYNRLFYDPRWRSPDYMTASVAERAVLRKANGEMAYYLLQHLADEDRRKGLQAQGVVKAGIVKEDYAEADLMMVPVPPFVVNLMGTWSTPAPAFGAVSIERDEEEGISR